MNYLKFEPVRSLSALLAFGSTIILIVAYKFNLDTETLGLIQGAWAGFIALVGTFVTREQVTPLADPKDENGKPLV